MLRIHNCMTGRKEVFQPLERGHVRLYVCGVTVYDYCHVGHARSQVVFDIVRRWLEAKARGHWGFLTRLGALRAQPS